MWVVPNFGIGLQTGKWSAGYERRKSTGFSNPDNKENHVACWMAAMYDVTANPVYRDRAAKWFGLMKSRLKTGAMGTANPFRFSSKWQDDETDLLYYGYRYLSTSTGRWNSRDPADEEGGEDLYAFVQNGPPNDVDMFGLCAVCCCCADGLSFKNIKTYTGLGAVALQFGHEFDVVAQLSFQPSSAQASCKLQWFEKSNVPYYPPQKPIYPTNKGIGTDMYPVGGPTSPTFAPLGSQFIVVRLS